MDILNFYSPPRRVFRELGKSLRLPQGGRLCFGHEELFVKFALFCSLLVSLMAPSSYGQMAQAIKDPISDTGEYEALGSELPGGEWAILSLENAVNERPATLTTRIFRDHQNYYSPQILAGLAFAFAGGAVIANTDIDREIYEDFQHSVTNASSDEWLEGFHAPKELGNGLYTLPLFAAAWSTGWLAESREAGGDPIPPVVSRWGEKSLRGFLVGAPPVILMQKVTGGSRPGEGASDWRFWGDNNGVSGHSFMGALPFLTAAQLSENRIARYSWYAASGLVPLSRISDGDHYASQAFLGWSMALAASIAVDQADRGIENWQVLPLLTPGQIGLAVEHRW